MPTRRTRAACVAVALILLAASGCSSTTSGSDRGTSRPSALAKTPGPGVTATSLNLGIIYTQNGGKINDAKGVKNSTVGTPKNYARIIVEAVNAAGGIAGRQITPIYHGQDATSPNTAEVTEQQTCNALTQDNKVLAVVHAEGTDSFLTCLANAGVLATSGGLNDRDSAGFREFPNYFEVGTMSLDRQIKTLASYLAADDFFGPEAKIGLITFAEDRYRRAIDTGLRPVLADNGLKLDQEVFVPKPKTAAEVAAQDSAVNSAVLRFRSAKVTHVLFLEVSGDLAFTFMQAAENQKYRPRYGLGSQDPAQPLADNIPKAQFAGAQGVGWSPLQDMGEDQDPDSQSFPSRQECLGWLNAAGETFTDTNAKLGAMIYCDEIRFIKAAAEKAGPVLNQDTLRVGAESLGTSFSSALTFSSRYNDKHHDGAAAVRPFRFFPDCGCFKYTAPPQPAP